MANDQVKYYFALLQTARDNGDETLELSIGRIGDFGTKARKMTLKQEVVSAIRSQPGGRHVPEL
jgi:hypothetical protein